MIKLLNDNYTTTKLCYKLLNDKYLENGKIKEEYKFKLNFSEFGIVDSKIYAKQDEKFDTFLFLQEVENRKGEGGLRTKGYFKFSYEKKDDKWCIVEDNKFIKEVKLSNETVKNYDKLPLISIITVVYNGEKYLEETIQSVINQTYPNVEYIIIDGGSTDGTLDLIKKYEDYIDYWVSEKDKGIYDAMNKGIDVVNGKWINFMNAGDKLLYLEERDLFINLHTFTNYFYDYEKKNVFRKPLSRIYLTRNTPCHQSIIYKRNELLKYDTNIPVIADFNQMLEISNLKDYIPSFGTSVVFYNEAGVSNFQAYTIREIYKYLVKRTDLIKKHLGIKYYILSCINMLRIFIKRYFK